MIVTKTDLPMKKLLLYLAILCAAALYSCQDNLDVEQLTNFPPTVLSVSPNVSVKLGTFELKAVLVTGPGSPLSSGTITLRDADGQSLFTVTKSLSGIKDSIVAKAPDFNSEDLALGAYNLEITAVNASNLKTVSSSVFNVSKTLYPAKNVKMYIAGEFNGWGATELTLVKDFTWEIKNVDLQGKAWKLKNTPDWTDQDWGDGDCDGLMTSNKADGGNKDTNCKFSGLVNLQFNDQTLTYTIKPAVTFKTNLSGLFVLGGFNNFEGENYKFQLKADNTWELGEIRLKPGDEFKFSESPYFKGKNYGDSGKEGVAAEFSPNFNWTAADAFYKISFNDATLKYTITLVRYPYPDKLYLVGSASSVGWNPGSSIQFLKTGDGKFEMYAYLTHTDTDGGFKFLQVQDWAGAWGKSTDGTLAQDGGNNIQVAVDGFYRITADFIAKTYTTTLTTWAVVGDATPGGWPGAGPDPGVLTLTGGSGTYKLSIDNITLTGGAHELKFRANNGWDINLGDDGANGSLEYGGHNIASPGDGLYRVELNLAPTGYTYTLTKK
jgi:hypothetical protein